MFIYTKDNTNTMKLHFSLNLLCFAGTALCAAISVREDNPVPPNFCCFHLRDVISGQNVRQNSQTGELFLNDSSLSQGWYCINQNYDSKVLYDRDNNACIQTSPGNEFQCLDGTPGGDTWEVASDGQGPYLKDYGNAVFSICNVNGRQQVFGPSPPGGLSCQMTILRVQDRAGQCK